jgi:hypothetical protein
MGTNYNRVLDGTSVSQNRLPWRRIRLAGISQRAEYMVFAQQAQQDIKINQKAP